MAAVKRSYDDIAKSEEDKRCYRGLELTNGLKVTLLTLAERNFWNLQLNFRFC